MSTLKRQTPLELEGELRPAGLHLPMSGLMRGQVLGLRLPFDDYRRRKGVLNDLAELYHENSKITRANMANLITSMQVFSEADLADSVRRMKQDFPTRQRIILPRPYPKLGLDLSKALRLRRSVRKFSKRPLSVRQLSTLLYYSIGVLDETVFVKESFRFRTYPSGGALYPVETYVTILNVNGLNKGVYFYCADHSLRKVGGDKEIAGVLNSFGYSPEILDVKACALILVFTGAFWRCRAKYGLPGYRYTFLEAGHAAQNSLLVATAMKLGSVPVVGFIEDEMNDSLRIDGVEVAALYSVLIGPPI